MTTAGAICTLLSVILEVTVLYMIGKAIIYGVALFLNYRDMRRPETTRAQALFESIQLFR